MRATEADGARAAPAKPADTRPSAARAVAEASHRLEQNPDAGLKATMMQQLEAIDASLRPSVTSFPHRKDFEGVTEALNAEIERLRSSGEPRGSSGSTASTARPPRSRGEVNHPLQLGLNEGRRDE